MAESRITRRSEPEFPSLSRRSSLLGARDYDESSPFSLFRRLSDEMDRTFANFRGSGSEPEMWAPPIEVRERDGKLLVTAELPGMRPEDVTLEVTDDGLCIQGERKQEHREEKEGYVRSERRYGTFYRCVPLPENVQTDQARAEFKNGVLEVTIPLPESQRLRRRQIEIHSGDGGAFKPVSSETTSTQTTPRVDRRVG